MHDDINTKRTQMANEFAAMGAANLDLTGTAAFLAAIPDTDPQQYAAAGTPENIAAILPATICPQRRQKHGQRPTEALDFDDSARIERATAPHGSAAPTEAAQVVCMLPPLGWHCTRAPGHEGPCAAVPTEICADDYTPEQQVIYQHGVEDGKLIARGMARFNAGRAAAPVVGELPPLPPSRHKARDFEGWAEVYTSHEVDNIRRAAVSASQAATVGDLTTVDCPTCNGHGLIGGHSGQTPESYEEHAQGCDDCDGQGKIIVSRAELAAASTAQAAPADTAAAYQQGRADELAEVLRCQKLAAQAAPVAGADLLKINTPELVKALDAWRWAKPLSQGNRLYELVDYLNGRISAAVAAAKVPTSDTRQYRKLTSDLSMKELASEFHAVAKLGGDVTISAGVCQKLFDAMTTPPAAPVEQGQDAGPEGGREAQAKEPETRMDSSLEGGHEQGQGAAFGMRVIVDPALPPDSMEVRSGKNTVRAVNIGQGAGVVPKRASIAKDAAFYALLRDYRLNFLGSPEQYNAIVAHVDRWAAATAHPVAADDQVRDQALSAAKEGSEILNTFIDNVATDGPYSAEATLTFISQAKQCVDEAIRSLSRTTAHGGAQGEQAAASDMDAVVNFLMGNAPLEDVEFGERHPTKAGAFWWRLNLRAAWHKALGAPR